MYDVKTAVAGSRFPGSAKPTCFAELPLDRLYASPANVRARDADQNIKSLAANIRVHGLINPLVVRWAGEDRYEVVSGQRRLLALRALAEEGGDPPLKATCQIVDLGAGEATALSLSENVERLPMDAFDQCAAFQRLIEFGLGVKEIAGRFGLAPKLVNQRLALAGLLEPIKELARTGKLNEPDARALAQVSAERQQAWLDADGGRQTLRGYHLKVWLFGGRPISTKVALFPLKDYPGEIVRDLFGTESFFGDSSLFWVHQKRAVAIRQEELKAGGWEQVIALEPGKVFLDWNYRRAAQDEGGWFYIEVRDDGTVAEHEGYLPVQEAQRREKVARGEAAADEPVKPGRAEVTGPMLNYLGLHKADAVRLKLMGDPGLALRLAVAFLVGGGANWSVKADETRPMKPAIAESLHAQTGRREVAARVEAAKALLFSPQTLTCANRFGVRPLTGGGGYPQEERTASLLRSLLAMDEGAVGRLLAVAVADTLVAGSALTELLGQHLKVDLRETWTPDKAFLDLVSDKTALQAIAAELGAAPPAQATGKELRAAIRARLDGQGGPAPAGWLPGYLQFPFAGYAPERTAPAVQTDCAALAALLEGSAEFEEPYANVRFGPEASEVGDEGEEGEDGGEGEDEGDDDFSIDAEDVA